MFAGQGPGVGQWGEGGQQEEEVGGGGGEQDAEGAEGPHSVSPAWEGSTQEGGVLPPGLILTHSHRVGYDQQGKYNCLTQPHLLFLYASLNNKGFMTVIIYTSAVILGCKNRLLFYITAVENKTSLNNWT